MLEASTGALRHASVMPMHSFQNSLHLCGVGVIGRRHYWTALMVTALAFHVQAAAAMDSVARSVLPLLLRGVGLRADALSGVLDDVKSPSESSSELHVARYRGPADGEPQLPRCSFAVLTPFGMKTRGDHGQE